MTYNKTNSRFFTLEFWKTDCDLYDRFFIIPEDGKKLDKIFAVTDYDKHEFQGAIALLRSETYPEYNQLFYVYRKDEDNEINITLYRCVDEEDNYIFIKNDESLKFNDCIFCCFDHKFYYTVENPNGVDETYITFFRKSGI